MDAKTMTSNGEKLKSEKVFEDNYVDNYKIVYIFFILVGVVLFMPVTFFTTASDYWMYKFRNTSFDTVDSNHRTFLETRFSPTVMICSTLTNIISSFMFLLCGYRLNFKLRLYGSLLAIVMLYVIGAIFIDVNTDSWQTGFFVLTMIMISAITGFGVIFGLTFLSILAKFPREFLAPFLNGQALAAIFTACLRIMSLAIGISTISSALVYFWIAILVIAFCIIYVALLYKYNSFFRYYNSKEPEKIEKKQPMTGDKFRGTIKYVWISLAILFFGLWTVGPTHPSITSLVVSEGKGNGDWNDVYFTPVVTFLIMAVGDLMGRQLPIRFEIFKNFQKINPIWYVVFSACGMVIFVPLIVLCNAQPRNHLPVIFSHDYQYILIMIAFALNSGFNICMGQFIIPGITPPEKLEDAYQLSSTLANVLMGAFSFLGMVSVDIL